MGRRRQARGRAVDGILLLDKPLGLTSNAALQQVKRLYKAAKAGHTGSLDPLASGMLPICLGNATKVSAFLLDADKHYWVRVRLGETTATGDAEGEVLATHSTEGVDAAAIAAALPGFLGPIMQMPPMYSALKHNGQRLYKLAREGIEVEREPREILIHALELGVVELPEFELVVHCSKGTYVRTLAEDIGAALGCGGHVVGLRRSGVGPYTDLPMHTMDELEALAEQGLDALDGILHPIDSALGHWPAVQLTPDGTFYIKQGQALLVPKAPTEGLVRMYQADGRFLGVGEVLDDGRIGPKRLMASG